MVSNFKMQDADLEVRKPGRPKAGDSEETRQALLHAARRIFAERGYEGTSMATISKGAALSSSAAYHYFPDKLAIYEAVFVQSLEAVWAPVYKQLEQARDLKEALTTVFSVSSDLDERHLGLPAFLATVSVDSLRFPELLPLLGKRDEYQREAFRMVAAAVGLSGEAPNDPDIQVELAEVLQKIVIGWAMEYLHDPEQRIRNLPSLLRIIKLGIAEYRCS